MLTVLLLIYTIILNNIFHRILLFVLNNSAIIFPRAINVSLFNLCIIINNKLKKSIET